jgi:malonyl-CoA decarboxylase
MNLIGRFTRNVLESVADAGENFLDLTGLRGTPSQKLVDLSLDLISHKGVASGIALARQLVNRYQKLDREEKLEFFIELNLALKPNLPKIKKAAENFIQNDNEDNLRVLSKSLRSIERKFFTRMNMAPNGTKAIVSLREDLLGFIPDHPELKNIDDALKILLTTWFNPGFLVLKKIDWDTEASILEKIIRYETVHNIANWNDLKQRLVKNRRCFAYFHPALEDEPLIFVEVALTRGITSSIQAIIDEEEGNHEKRKTAIFYSINNCQRGLKGIPLGNFLIKMVVNELDVELPSIKKYSSLSPITGFSNWLFENMNSLGDEFDTKEKTALELLNKPGWQNEPKIVDQVKKPLMKACAHYLVKMKRDEKPLNAVARFHFGNGAELFRINWMGNTSAHGMEDSFGLMVNYRYDLKRIESNHEDYVRNGKLAISKSVRNLL